METKVVGRRVAALLVDSVLVGVVNFVLLIAISAVAGTTETSGSSFSFNVEGAAAGVYLVVALGVAVAYFVVWQGRTGATLGKRMVDIRVVKDDGSGDPPGVGRALARWFLFIADGFPYVIPYLTGFVVALSTKDNKRIGDMVASTLVVRKDA